MTKQITVPRETWDAVVEALTQIDEQIDLKAYHCAPPDITLFDVAREALTAANAVSEAQPAGPEDMAIYNAIADGYLAKVQPVDDWTIRGTLAAKLKCWHRLKEDEASELVRLFAANAVQPQAQVDESVYCFVYEWDTPFGLHRATTYERWNGNLPNRSVPVYTHPQATEQAGWKLTDEHLQAAIYCREAGHVSVSLVQRKLKTGYNAAQKICQQIINAGLVPGLKIAPSLTTAAAPEAP